VFDAERIAPGVVFPIHEYDNAAANAGCPEISDFEGQAVIAGYVVRDERLTRQYGRLLYTDSFGPDIRTLIPVAGATDERSSGVQPPAGFPVSFAEGFANQLYLISGGGPVYRLDPA
jgi:hypothetical protein